MARVITIASGRSGVGKTTLAVNLALHLASEGGRVCLLESGSGMEAIDGLFGLNRDGSPRAFAGPRRGLGNVLLRNYHGIDLLPTGAAMAHLRGLDTAVPPLPETAFGPLGDYDYCLVETPADLSRATLAFCLAAPEIVLVVSPEQASLNAAYGLIRVLHMNGYAGKLMAVVNRCRQMEEGRHAYETLHKVAASYLHAEVPLLALVFEDEEVRRALERQRPVAIDKPDSVASRCIRDIARRLREEPPSGRAEAGIESFWSRLLWFLTRPLVLPHRVREAPAAALPAIRRGDQSAGSLVEQIVTTLSGWLAKAREWQSVLQDREAAFRSGRGRNRESGIMARLLRNFAWEKRKVGYRKTAMEIYYVEREPKPPLICAYHGPDGGREEEDKETREAEAGAPRPKQAGS